MQANAEDDLIPISKCSASLRESCVRLLHAAGFRLIVIPNQSGVALGRFPESALAEIEAQLKRLLRDAGSAVAEFSYCPRHPKGIMVDFVQECYCRKPRPALIIRADGSTASHWIDLGLPAIYWTTSRQVSAQVAEAFL